MKNKSIILLLFPLFFLTSSCKILSTRKSNKQDSTALHRSIDTQTNVDTSKHKSESQYTKETFIYPPRDTTINNFYQQPAAQPTVYIREVGSKKEEDNTAVFQQRLNQVLDSMNANKQQTDIKKDVRVGPSFIEWILICAVGLMFLKQFSPTIIKLLSK